MATLSILLLAALCGTGAAELPGMNFETDFVDVTKAPYNADPTGVKDATTALQKAIDDAHTAFKVVYLPLGEYLVSDKLQCLTDDTFLVGLNNTVSSRFKPQVVIGQRSPGNNSDGYPIRPTLKLKDHSGLNTAVIGFFVGPVGGKAVWGNTQGENTQMNALFRGIDIQLGEGNPGASGVWMAGAQGTGVQDTTVYVESGYSGIMGCPGAGGSHANVRVVGGKIGLDCTAGQQNVPTTHVFRLEGQTEAAILYTGNGNGGAMFVGGYVAPASTKVPVMKVLSSDSGNFGQGLFVDTVVEYPASGADGCLAIDSDSKALYFRNTYIKNCRKLTNLKCLDASQTESATNEWKLNEVSVSLPYGYASDPHLASPIYLDGVKAKNQQTCAAIIHAETSAGSGTPPTADLAAPHRWDELDWPTPDMPVDATHKIFNVKDPQYGATGDANTDDAAAMQKAFDAAAEFATASANNTAVIRVPKGFYRLSKTLTMNSNVAGRIALVGTSRMKTILMPTTDFGEAANAAPQPLLHVTSGNGRVVITEFAMVVWYHSARAWAMHWENTNVHSWYRSNYFYRNSECRYGFPHPSPVPQQGATIPCKPVVNMTHPLSVISGAGHFSNFENEDSFWEAPSYRHLLVDRAQNVSFYALNTEHAISEANCEISNSENVNIFGFKTEPGWKAVNTDHSLLKAHNPATAIWIRNTSAINIFGFGGNGCAQYPNTTLPSNFAQFTPSLYRIENSCPLRMVDVMDSFVPKPAGIIEYVMINEHYDGVRQLTHVGDRPSWYGRLQC